MITNRSSIIGSYNHRVSVLFSFIRTQNNDYSEVTEYRQLSRDRTTTQTANTNDYSEVTEYRRYIESVWIERQLAQHNTFPTQASLFIQPVQSMKL